MGAGYPISDRSETRHKTAERLVERRVDGTSADFGVRVRETDLEEESVVPLFGGGGRR